VVTSWRQTVGSKAIGSGCYSTGAEWPNLGLGLIVSSWLLGFQDSDAMTIDVAIGASLAALAAFEVWLTRDNAPRVPASQ